jgi:MFS family permease
LHGGARRGARHDEKGFSTIMSAQFFSSLADNALLVAAVELLRTVAGASLAACPRWRRCSPSSTSCSRPSSAPSPTRMPKGRVMFVSNAIKVVGCLLMLFGAHPLLAYAVVGLGAAAYSPAKYGILTELLPPSQLVKGNGWIEGLTIGSIVLGILLGGQLIGARIVAGLLLGLDMPLLRHRHRHRARSGHLPSSCSLYVVAAAVQPVHARAPARRCSPMQSDAVAPGARLRAAATAACGPTSWARSRWPRRRCSGACSATCGYIVLRLGGCGAGLRHHAGLQRWPAWWPSARSSARWWPRSSMKLDRATNVIPLGIGVGLAR